MTVVSDHNGCKPQAPTENTDSPSGYDSPLRSFVGSLIDDAKSGDIFRIFEEMAPQGGLPDGFNFKLEITGMPFSGNGQSETGDNQDLPGGFSLKLEFGGSPSSGHEGSGFGDNRINTQQASYEGGANPYDQFGNSNPYDQVRQENSSDQFGSTNPLDQLRNVVEIFGGGDLRLPNELPGNALSYLLENHPLSRHLDPSNAGNGPQEFVGRSLSVLNEGHNAIKDGATDLLKDLRSGDPFKLIKNQHKHALDFVKAPFKLLGGLFD